MEIFKTQAGSWIYPEPNFFRIGGVPLFSGFMYACIGSYLCRAWRLFDFEFSHHPRRLGLAALSVAIYLNFFSHHLHAGPALAAVRMGRLAVLPHPRLFQGLARPSFDAAVARARAGVALHLVLGKHRHVHQDLALSVAAARLVDGFRRQARLLVSAADHQLHAGEPGQCAAGQARGGACGARPARVLRARTGSSPSAAG